MSDLPKTALSKCLQCHTKMPKFLTTLDGKLGSRSNSISSIDRKGYFCTLRCAAKYGFKAANGGKS